MGLWQRMFGQRVNTADGSKGLASEVEISALRLQVFRDSYFAMKLLDRSSAAVRPLTSGLSVAVVEDVARGNAERTVRWDELRRLGLGPDEAFELARRQAAAAETGIQTQMIADAVQVMVSNGFYLSAALLDTLARNDLKRGALVAPVSWHHWCVHLVQDLTVPPIVPLIEMVAGDLASQIRVTDAERLGTNVYWVRPGGQVFEPIDFVGQGAERSARLPPDLARLIGAD